MKKTVKRFVSLTLAIIMALATVVGCTSGEIPPIAENTQIQGENTLRGEITSEDFSLELRSNPIYEIEEYLDDVISPSGGGPATSYEELVEELYREQPLNFVKYEIIGIYTPEEAEKITNGEINTYVTTLYRARVIYDYLNQERLDIEINLARAGTATRQWKGNPMYAIGEVYISPLLVLSEFLNKDEWRSVGMSELTFAVHEINDIEFAYSMRYNWANPDSVIEIKSNDRQSFDIGVLSSEESVVTTTRNNPVRYTQKLLVDELAEFIRNDWKERGFEFLDLSKY
jgi:hypothetical protein